MSIGKRLQKASQRAVSKFANTGNLIEPDTYDYDSLTGDLKGSPTSHPFEYVTVTDKTDKNTGLKAASFRESVVYFTVIDTLVINETWCIEGLKKELYDILQLEKVVVNDIIVGYYALMKVRL